MEVDSPVNIQSFPTLCVCSGIITSQIKGTETWEVSIYESPMGDFSGPVYATMVYSPGQDGNLKQGDHVKALVYFMYGGTKMDYEGLAPGKDNYIIGLFNERSLINEKIENPISEYKNDSTRFINQRSGAGVIATNSGHVTLSTGGAISHILKPFGFGMNKNCIRSNAQNMHRVISHNSPFYLTREYFGMYTGADLDAESSNTSEEDSLISFKRFVQQTQSLDKWVSTCEGSYNPWVGPNNDIDGVDKSKDVLFSKVINNDESRVSIEIGEPGDEFFLFRVDDVKTSERKVEELPGATPAVVGNRFKMKVSDTGVFEFRSNGDGIPNSNINGLCIKSDDDGGLTINVKGKVTVTHGDDDETNNSVVMDPKSGIDVTALNGFRVNGQEVALKSFIDWFDKFQDTIGQVTSPGGPVPIHPSALPDFTAGVKKLAEKGGFTSIGSSAPAKGVIQDSDEYQSV